ncbi:hypothetical protein QVD17_30891 [Tagetes erecta]|uniref:Uncharacterized protein n=1 Tax=Tagetes erecta TaxID=13708 RepID=A0AAD8K8R3_TARER|nr:hypothetical protein QVD17_30891 [Tagetes erecta]
MDRFRGDDHREYIVVNCVSSYSFNFQIFFVQSSNPTRRPFQVPTPLHFAALHLIRSDAVPFRHITQTPGSLTDSDVNM